MKKNVLLSCILSMLILASCGNSAPGEAPSENPEPSETAGAAEIENPESLAPSKPADTEIEAAAGETDVEGSVGGLTDFQKENIDFAKEILKDLPLSRNSLIDYLHKDGLGFDDAQFAADHCGADWKEEAVKAAREIVEKQGIKAEKEYLLLHLTEARGFTEEEAAYGADTYLSGK